MSNATKNFSDQGGNRFVVSGEINMRPAGKQTANGKQAEAIVSHADPKTATSEEIANKQNEILAALRGVGIIPSK
jgi:hypothetical protein